jgi:hypothetical protein
MKALRWAAAVLALLAASPAWAVAIRGRIDYLGPVGAIPMAGANVALCSSPANCIRYVTGPDGMYYFNVAPGAYTILVNGGPRHPVQVPQAPQFDVAPIRGN